MNLTFSNGTLLLTGVSFNDFNKQTDPNQIWTGNEPDGGKWENCLILGAGGLGDYRCSTPRIPANIICEIIL